MDEKEIRAKSLELSVRISELKQSSNPTMNCSHIDDILYRARVFENFIRNGE